MSRLLSFLLHDGLYVVKEDAPDIAFRPDILNVCMKHWKAALPLHNWLMEYV